MIVVLTIFLSCSLHNRCILPDSDDLTTVQADVQHSHSAFQRNVWGCAPDRDSSQ